MSSKRTTITISEAVLAKARAVMDARAFEDFSGFVQQLIREEFERRNGPVTLNEQPSTSVPKPGKPVRYPPLRTTAKK